MKLLTAELDPFSSIPTAKITVPHFEPTLVTRPRLLDQLAQAGLRPVTLIIAPAGSGKTTLVRQWVRGNGRSTVWLTLDSHDNELYRFLSGLIASLRILGNNPSLRLERLILNAGLVPADQLADELLADLAAIPRPVDLVLDDFHEITDSAIVEILSRVIHYLPQDVHLILVSRNEPALSLARLRARRQISEINAGHLRFSTSETEELLISQLGGEVSAETLQTIDRRSEGWAAGILLLAHRHASQEALATALREEVWSVTSEYFTQEVLADLTPSVLHFLQITSIVEQITPDLAAALIGRNDDEAECAAILQRLVSTNRFTTMIEGERTWYRYHQLMRSQLEAMLSRNFSSDEIAALHRRVAFWCEANGFHEMALSHATTAADWNLVIDIISRQSHAIIDSGHRWMLVRWLSGLPSHILEMSPQLLSLRAVLSNLESDWQQSQQYIEQTRKRLTLSPAVSKESQQKIDGEIAVIRSLMLFWKGSFEQSVTEAERALANPYLKSRFLRGIAEQFRAQVWLAQGRKDDSVRRLTEIIHSAKRPADPLVNRAYIGLLIIQYWSAKSDSMLQTAQRFRDHLGDRGQATDLLWFHTVSAYAHHLSGNYEQALESYSFIRNNNAMGTTSALFLQAVLDKLAQAYEIYGDHDSASAVMAEMHSLFQHSGNKSIMRVISLSEARLQVLQGDERAAITWLDGFDGPAMPEHLFSSEAPYYLKVRLLLTQGSARSLDQAVVLLEQMRDIAERTNCFLHEINLSVALAEAYCKQRRTTRARNMLAHALNLAASGPAVRPFLESGPEILDLLQEMAAESPHADFIRLILTRYATLQSKRGERASAEKTRAQEQDRLPEPLTEREMEVLSLLGERRTNQEIAQELTITQRTVKHHNSNIFQKLGVTNRRQAEQVARELGLLHGLT